MKTKDVIKLVTLVAAVISWIYMSDFGMFFQPLGFILTMYACGWYITSECVKNAITDFVNEKINNNEAN